MAKIGDDKNPKGKNAKDKGDKKPGRELNPTQYFHHEFLIDIEDNLYQMAEGNPILRYVEYKDAKYRVVHYMDPLFEKKKLVNLNKTVFNRRNSEIHCNFENKLRKEVWDKLSHPSRAFYEYLDLAPKAITDRDIDYLSKYVTSPDKFLKENKEFCSTIEINKTYSKYLSRIIGDESKKSAFLRLKTVGEKTEFLKTTIGESNYKNLLNSKSHSKLLIKRSFSSNKKVDEMIQDAKKSGPGLTALSGVLFAYDYSTYDHIDINRHPVKELVESTIIEYGVSISVPHILAAVGLTAVAPGVLSGVILVTSAVVVPIVVDGIDEFIKENDIGGITTQSNLNLRNKILNDKYSSVVYVVIKLFFEKYLKSIENFNKVISLMIKAEKNRKEKLRKSEAEKLFLPKPMNADYFDPQNHDPQPKLVRCDYPLNELKNVELANQVIEDYISELELTAKLRASSPNDYQESLNKNWVRTHSETTQMFSKQIPKKKEIDDEIKIFKRLLNDDINLFYLYLNFWDTDRSSFIRAEFTETRLFGFIEPYL